MNSPHIYVISTEADTEGSRRILGYATGKPEHIRAFYTDLKANTLYLDEVPVLEITPETVLTKKALAGQKTDLEERLHRIERELRELGAVA